VSVAQPVSNCGSSAARLARVRRQHERHPELHRLADQRPGLQERPDPGRHDTDDGARPRVQPNGFADNRRIGSESPLPEVVAEYDSGRLGVRALLVREHTSDHRRDAEHGEKRRRDVLHDELLRVAGFGQVDPRLGIGSDALERSGTLAPPNEVRRRDGVRPAGPPCVRFPQDDDLARVAIWQAFDQDGMHQRENRRVGTNPERERHHGDRREARRAQT